MKNRLSYIYNIEKKIWGEQTNPNRYLATFIILLAAIMGAFLGGSEFLNEMFNWDIKSLTLTASIGMLIFLIAYNVAESIIATETANVATLRSLILSGFVILAFVIGVVASVIILLAVTIFVAIYIIITAIQIALGNGVGSKGKRWKLDNGDQVREEKGLLGESYYKGSSGKSYDTNDGGETFTEN